jgi:hypothetical protein
MEAHPCRRSPTSKECAHERGLAADRVREYSPAPHHTMGPSPVSLQRARDTSSVARYSQEPALLSALTRWCHHAPRPRSRTASQAGAPLCFVVAAPYSRAHLPWTSCAAAVTSFSGPRPIPLFVSFSGWKQRAVAQLFLCSVFEQAKPKPPHTARGSTCTFTASVRLRSSHTRARLSLQTIR